MALRTVVNATLHPDAGLSAAASVVAPLWSLVKGLRRSAVVRAAVSVVGIIAALALQPEPGRPVGVASMRARVLLLSAQARRYLFLQYRSYATEFMGCMIGTIRGDAVIVERIAPADVAPAQSTPTRLRPRARRTLPRPQGSGRTAMAPSRSAWQRTCTCNGSVAWGPGGASAPVYSNRSSSCTTCRRGAGGIRAPTPSLVGP